MDKFLEEFSKAFLYKEFLFENDKCKFYANDNSKRLTSSCTDKSINSSKLLGYKVYLVEKKSTGEEVYVLYNKNGEPVAADKQFIGLATIIEMLRLRKEYRITKGCKV